MRLLCEALDCNSLAELRGIDSRNLVKAAVKINGPAGHNFFLPTPDDSVFFPAVLTAATPPAADISEEKAAGTVTATAKLACADTTSLLPTLQGINEREGAFLTGAFLASLLGKVSVQGVKSLWSDCSVFPVFGTEDTDRWRINVHLCATCAA